MQIKTIEKAIREKIEAWMSTINDEILRENVKKHVIVTGGCIVSMFDGKPVNDYDVYIEDMNTLTSLAKYYTQNDHRIWVMDGRIKEKLEAELSEQYKGKGIDAIYNATAVAIRNLHPHQVRLFFGGDAFRKVEEIPAEGSYQPLFFSANAITLSDNIQLVCRFCGDIAFIHENFDFVHATNYFTFKSGLVTNIKALESFITKQLSYQGSKYPLTSILRMKKFVERGWRINAGEVLKIMFQISELDLKNPDVLEEQLIGVDVAYFDTLVNILRGKETQNMTSKYLNEIINRVFNSAEDTR